MLTTYKCNTNHISGNLYRHFQNLPYLFVLNADRGLDLHPLQIGVVLCPVHDVVEVDGAPQLARPPPPHQDRGVGPTRDVSQQRLTRTADVRTERERLRTGALVLARLGVQPHRVAGVGSLGGETGTCSVRDGRIKILAYAVALSLERNMRQNSALWRCGVKCHIPNYVSMRTLLQSLIILHFIT